MFDQIWVNIYISIVIFFTLLPIFLICCWVSRVCFDEFTLIENSESDDKPFEALKRVVVNETSTSQLDSSKLSTV